jgi:hypothetical protein
LIIPMIIQTNEPDRSRPHATDGPPLVAGQIRVDPASWTTITSRRSRAGLQDIDQGAVWRLPPRDLPCVQKLEGSSPNGYAAAISEVAPIPVEPPEPTPEQLAELRALVERVRDGDRSEIIPRDQAAAELGL